jgi:5'-nucleotidase
MKRLAMSAALALCASPAFALNIVLANDDGLTSNVKALYEELKAAGHSVIVSVPCTGQSGRSAAIVMYSTTTIIPDNDKTQIEAEGGCHNGAAPTGAPAVGPFTKSGYTNGDYNYVHGTPVMATMYGLDVAPRAGKAPDLVLSGPNEGQNVGRVVINSGTIGNAQFAAGARHPGHRTERRHRHRRQQRPGRRRFQNRGATDRQADRRTAAKAGSSALLPAGTALNVNFPNAVSASGAGRSRASAPILTR